MAKQICQLDLKTKGFGKRCSNEKNLMFNFVDCAAKRNVSGKKTETQPRNFPLPSSMIFNALNCDQRLTFLITYMFLDTGL